MLNLRENDRYGIYPHLPTVHKISLPVKCRLCDKELSMYSDGFLHLFDHAIADAYGWTEAINVRLKGF